MKCSLQTVFDMITKEKKHCKRPILTHLFFWFLILRIVRIMMLLRLLLANMTFTKVSHKEGVQSSSNHLILPIKTTVPNTRISPNRQDLGKWWLLFKCFKDLRELAPVSNAVYVDSMVFNAIIGNHHHIPVVRVSAFAYFLLFIEQMLDCDFKSQNIYMYISMPYISTYKYIYYYVMCMSVLWGPAPRIRIWKNDYNK